MRTISVIGLFIMAFLVVAGAIHIVGSEGISGSATGVQLAKPNFLQRIFGVGDSEAEAMEVQEETTGIGDLEPSEEPCIAVRFEEGMHSGQTANQICSDRDCQWVMSVRERQYFDSDSNICQGKIEAKSKEYSLAEHSCSEPLFVTEGGACSKFTTVKSAEPRLGDVLLTEYNPFEIMCC